MRRTATYGLLWVGLVVVFLFGGYWGSAATLVGAPAVRLLLLFGAWTLAAPDADSEGDNSRIERVLRFAGTAVFGVAYPCRGPLACLLYTSDAADE